MNYKDLLIPLAVALLATWAIQYFFFPRVADNRTDIVTDKRFVAPTSLQVVEPLDFAINFHDVKPTRPKQITEVILPKGIVRFSNDGAVIDFLAYKRVLGGKETLIETLVPAKSKESGAFLVALNGLGATPFYYDLVDKKDTAGFTTITYKGESPAAVIIKEFGVHHDTYTIDLKITVEPKGEAKLRPRVIFPAPEAAADATSGVVRAVLASGKSVEITPLKDLANVGIEQPSLLGLEDHYFINAMIKDPKQFAQRGYFKIEGETGQVILQAGPVQTKTTWELSFYCGPKELSSLSAVDPRLEGVLEYGWFSFFAKILLYLLIFFYGILGNYGLAIIAVTVLVRLIMVPFTIKGEMTKKKHTEAQRKLQYIEQKYKHDPEQLAKEKAEFAKKHGIPGLLGCLPLLLQLPIFIGLQRVLANAIELYKAPFLWISDLSARDPYYILPVTVAIGMIFQLAQTGDPRQRVANSILALIIAAVTANLSAGLTLFISVSTLLGLAQTALQKWIKL